VRTRRIITLLAHAFVGWALCTASMGIGMAVTSEQNAIIIHAIAAPIIFAAVSWFYFRKFAYTTPGQTAIVFTSLVILVDFFVVALLVLRSMEMFASPLGTWIPFALIFASTYLTGSYVEKRSGVAASSPST
jgi:uncharacterized membrane protein YGL010W